MKYFDGFGLTVEGPMTAEAVSWAHRLAYLTRSESAARGLLAYRKYIELPDGGYAYAVKHGDIVRVRVVPRPEEPDPQLSIGYPDFASGIHTDFIVREVAGPLGPTKTVHGFYPTSGTQNRLGLGSGPVSMERFAVTPADDRDDLMNQSKNPNAVTYAQHAMMRGSLFSGRMVRLVQALLGFGKFKAPGAFDAVLEIEEDTVEDYIASLTTHELTCFLQGVKVRYDNRFYRTHGVIAGANNKWYIAQISPRGVYATPLRLWRGTDSQEFREYLEEQGDNEALTLLDEFGGFPTGEAFPAIADGAMDAAIRAGLVVRLMSAANIAPAYALMPFSTGMGWAFNASGTEAHNVLYEYGPDDFMYTQHVHFQFSTINELPKQTDTEDLQDELRTRLKDVKVSVPDYKLIVMSKLPWLERSALSSLINTAKADPVAAFNQLDATTVTRLTGSVSLGMSARNKVWYPGKNLAAPPMKFHEPLLPGLMSVDLRKLGLQWGNYKYPQVQDCMMHVYFIGDSLKYVKWYWDMDQKTFNETEDDYEDCMWQGSWTKVERSGTTELGPGFYHSDLDPRIVPAPTEKTTKIVSRYVGVTPYLVSDDITYLARGWVTRAHRFEREETITTVHGRGRRTACIVPAGTREGVLFGWAEEQQNTSVSYSKTWPRMTDPWWYEFARWFGTWRFGPGGIIGGGGWVPLNQKCGYHYERKVVATFYSPTLCSDIVDEGSWLDECQVVDIQPPVSDRPTGYYASESTEQVFHVLADFPPLGGMTEVYEHVWTPTPENPYRPWEANWFYPSPDEYGNVQQCNIIWNGLGDSDLVLGNTGPDNYGPGIFRGNPNRDVFRGASNFVGVVDGSP